MRTRCLHLIEDGKRASDLSGSSGMLGTEGRSSTDLQHLVNQTTKDTQRLGTDLVPHRKFLVRQDRRQKSRVLFRNCRSTLDRGPEHS